jgi:hypothetical protein
MNASTLTRRRLLSVAAAGTFGAPALLRGQAAGVEDLATAHDFESHRITSADPTGGNHDLRELEPGATLVLADISGPGRIVHFRDNITSHEQHWTEPQA